jgi:hypothetical protein
MSSSRILLLVAASCLGAQINPELLNQPWSASWISVPGAPPFDYGVYHFRKTFQLGAKPAHFVIHVSADNRYELFVNGERSVNGPARGDLYHWRYETVDIAPMLKAGSNTLAAVVWNFGPYAPEAQLTWQTGFLVQGDTQAERAIDTGASWRCTRNEAYSPLPVTHGDLRGYFVAGPGERIDAAKYPWRWEQPGFDDGRWSKAVVLSNGAPRDSSDAPNRWMLVPRTLPAMEEKLERIVAVRESNGAQLPAGWPAKAAAFTVPANTKARFLLDQSYLTTGHTELDISGGKGATISLGYAEALVEAGNYQGEFRKGNRNEIAGKRFVGYKDVFVADGGRHRVFRPLWWRTWRYLEFTIETGAEAVTINDLRGVFSAYPFERRAELNTGNPEIDNILDIGWRTARLCAHETYMDCPYYEQLQYVGDTRIQALVSLYMSGDDRLMRNAIAQLNESRTAEGATYSRAPSRLQQYIPPFSLWWIGMVHDYWMYRDDPQFVGEMLPGVRQVLTFFGRYQKQDGTLGRVPWWNFGDWVPAWPDGVPPRDADGSESSIIDLQLLLAYQWAADLEDELGSRALAADDRNAAARLGSAIQARYWDGSRRLYSDNSDHSKWSEHADILAILAGLVKEDDARALLRRTLEEKGLEQPTFYFRHYLHTALNLVGDGDRYVSMLEPWRGMMRLGLTTWAENPEPARSDCHAWSASPNFELFRTVLGVDSAAPGFKKVSIRPFLGDLKQVAGSVPHPNGTIQVRLSRRSTDGIHAEIDLPVGTTGVFAWAGRTKELSSGQNVVEF